MLKKAVPAFFQRRLRKAWFSLRSRNQAHKNAHDFARPSVAGLAGSLKDFFNCLLRKL
jgi:hypothetical protein